VLLGRFEGDPGTRRSHDEREAVVAADRPSAGSGARSSLCQHRSGNRLVHRAEIHREIESQRGVAPIPWAALLISWRLGIAATRVACSAIGSRSMAPRTTSTIARGLSISTRCDSRVTVSSACGRRSLTPRPYGFLFFLHALRPGRGVRGRRRSRVASSGVDNRTARSPVGRLGRLLLQSLQACESLQGLMRVLIPSPCNQR